MSFEAYVAIAAASVVGVIVLGLLIWKLPRRVKRDRFVTKWNKLQQRCADKTQWAQAIIEADDLLDEALKKKRFKGSSTGERLVSAQKVLTNNDAIWFGHKLRTKLDANPSLPLQKEDVQKALLGLKQGLKDIGVF